MLKLIVSTAVLCAIIACTSLGFIAPKSLDESLAEAETQVTGFELSATQALAAGAIKAPVAQQVLTYSDEVTTAITAARVAESVGDSSTAQGKLSLVTSLLAQLTAYLQAQGVK